MEWLKEAIKNYDKLTESEQTHVDVEGVTLCQNPKQKRVYVFVGRRTVLKNIIQMCDY